MSKAGGTHRSVSDQLKDAANELWLVLAPAVLFGTGIAVAVIAFGSVLGKGEWVIAVSAVGASAVVMAYIVRDRLETLSKQPPEEAEEYE